MDSEAKGFTPMSPPLIITPGNDLNSYPRRSRLKKPISRNSLATDRFSCTSFLTTASRISEESWTPDLPRWRSLPSNLEDELFYDDYPDILRAWSKYRLTNMSRRYKTMDYINMMIESRDEILDNNEIDLTLGSNLSSTIGLSVSRDLMFTREDFSEQGSANITRSPSDDQLSCSGEKQQASCLTEANIMEALSRVSANSSTESLQSLNRSHRKMNKIERWLFRCRNNPRGDFID
ncbi:predicted protein [Nematostella vectensis]|uniref:Uncharacterized protein n=1 Tax=Nematostella vectensis TaxID=45351 RepID=A7STQ5_NEMVE|nr:predicted protein [Nematostella vectensis]|eukprot:XP_001625000.1 predicted protein [Nematostella vectensis]